MLAAEKNEDRAQTVGGDAAPRHVAIIMDGNGRWASRRGVTRLEGHRAGVEAARRAVRAARDQGVMTMTLYSFSTENWSRPDWEVRHLMGLLRRFFQDDLSELAGEGVRVRIIGDHSSLPRDLYKLVTEAEERTCHNSAFTLQIAFNYGGRDEIVRAARTLARAASDGTATADTIDEAAFSAALDTADVPDPDLLIRTSGEQRISNFLLWQAAYAELVFLDCLWPDFGGEELAEAIALFRSRDRRYGGRKGEAAAAL
jgi:undecaprenyl diphosphate synthase